MFIKHFKHAKCCCRQGTNRSGRLELDFKAHQQTEPISPKTSLLELLGEGYGSHRQVPFITARKSEIRITFFHVNIRNSEVFPSVRTHQAKGQLAVQLGKELPRGKQKLLLLLITHIKLESFHLLQVSNTICCLKRRWHWSSAALRACLINQTRHQQIWNVSVIVTIPFFFLFEALNMFWLDLHYRVNYFFARESRIPVSSSWMSGPQHFSFHFQPWGCCFSNNTNIKQCQCLQSLAQWTDLKMFS